MIARATGLVFFFLAYMSKMTSNTKIICFEKDKLPTIYSDDIGGFHAYVRNCDNKISESYVRYALANADYVILALKPASDIKHLPETRRRSAKLVVAGFAFMQYTESRNGLYISLICSNNRTGRLILGRIESKAIALKLDFVNLTAVEGATSFYYKNDYKYIALGRNPCNTRNAKRNVKKKDGDSYTWDMAKCVAPRKS